MRSSSHPSTWPTRSTGVSSRAGYRTIEGGADNATVYTFALLNHLGLGLSVRL